MRASRILLPCALVLAATASAQVEDYRQIEFPPLPAFEIPRPEIFELDNGMTVFLLEDHELPLIEVLARVRTGSVWEPANRTGLARLAGEVQRTGGAGERSGDEIDDFLEARAAAVETQIGPTVGFASMDALADDFDEVFPVFLDILRRPRFAEDKLEIAKIQARAGIARRNDDVLAITAREFSRLVYGSASPLARLEEYATIDAVERDDLVRWHERFYHPNNILLGVVGDFDSAKMKERLRRELSGWPRGSAFEAPPVAFAGDEKPGVYFIEKADVTQANIRLGHLGITYDNPDYFALEVMNEILGGGFSSRLFSRIRSDKGLAYSVGGGVGASFLYPGVASFRLQTKSETMGEAVDALFSEVRGMTSEPPTPAELERAKDTILNSFIFNYASSSRVLAQQMLYAYYGLPVDFLETYRQRIEAVALADVMRVAEKYLHPDRATLLVVGRAADFDRPLASFGEVTELDISIPQPEDASADVESTPATREAGREVLARMVAALGGEDPKSARGVRSTASLVLTMEGQAMELEQELVLVYPDRVYNSLQTPMGPQVVVLDGDEGFIVAAGETQALPGEEVERRLRELARDPGFIVRFHDTDALEVDAVGAGEVGGEPCTVIAVALNGAASRLCIAADGRLLEQRFSSSHPFTGAPGDFEVRYSDYREIDGRLVPHRRVTRIDGRDFATVELRSFELDPAVDEGLFLRPAA